jgi:hypothetical protein
MNMGNSPIAGFGAPLLWLALLLPLGFALVRASDRPPDDHPKRVEAVEISPATTALLPRGKEADGIIGDFVLRNGYVHALVSASRPGRKANYATERGFVTAGALYDFDVAGADNDQLTVFRPGGLGGDVSWVRIVEDGRDGAAVVETVRTVAMGDTVIQQFRDELAHELRARRLVGPADPVDDAALRRIDSADLNAPFAEKRRFLEAIPGGISVRHEYRLEAGWRHLQITSTFRNHSAERKRVPVLPVWKEFSRQWEVGPVRVGDSIDPADRRAYAWAPVTTDPDGRLAPDDRLERGLNLAPGQEESRVIVLTVADSPLAAYGLLAGLTGVTGRVQGTARDATGHAAVRAAIELEVEGQTLPAYPASDGTFSFELPPGVYTARLVDIGRPTEEQQFVVRGGDIRLDFTPRPASAVRVDVQEDGAGFLPAVVEFIGLDGTTVPNLGPMQRARGCDNRYYSPTGRFVQQLPPGRYLVRVMRGPEYDVFAQEIEIEPDQTAALEARLERTVSTEGWVSTDYHVHSTDSGDNYTGAEDRVIALAAEHIEFAAATEHNRIGDWSPHIARLGLSGHLATAPGIELTRSGEFHLNAFPLEPRPFTQDNGAPPWHPDPRISALTLRALFPAHSDGWVHLNHPVVGTIFNDRHRDHLPDGGYSGLEHLIDGTEAWSSEILNPSIWYDRPRAGNTGELERRENRTFGWLQLLNQGRRIWIIAVSDSHSVCGRGAGGWRTYVASATDDPGSIDPAELVRSSKAGRMMITNGPFLTVRTSDGKPVGSTVTSPGFVDLEVRVETADWIDIDRVQVLVNGRALPEYNYTREARPEMFGDGVVQFDQRIRISLQADAHLIVVATSEHLPLSGAWKANRVPGQRPMAYTNPIFVDVDGNGFNANGDTLGHPLLVTPRFRQRY